MNKQRRAELSKAIDLLQKMTEFRDQALQIVQDCASDERDAYENLSEGLQAGERGCAMDEAASALDDIGSEIETFDIDDLISRIDEARGQ